MKKGIKLDKKPKPIIHWRNPRLRKFYYPKGLRRKKISMPPRKHDSILRKPLFEEDYVFAPSRVIPKKEVKIFYPSEVISLSKKTIEPKHKTF